MPPLRLFIAQWVHVWEAQWFAPGADYHVPTAGDPTPTRAEPHYSIQVMLFPAADEEAAYRKAVEEAANESDVNFDGPGDRNLYYTLGLHELEEYANAANFTADLKRRGVWITTFDPRHEMRTATYVYRLIGCVLLSIAALAGGGCASAGGSQAPAKDGAQAATPDVAEIGEAERVAEQIERARIAGDWAEVNRHLSTVGFTPAQRAATPSMPFAELARKAGELKSFELLVSVGGADYRDPKTGRTYPRVTVNLRESYSRFASPIHAELAMLKEDGRWRLAGVVAAGRR